MYLIQFLLYILHPNHYLLIVIVVSIFLDPIYMYIYILQISFTKGFLSLVLSNKTFNVLATFILTLGTLSFDIKHIYGSTFLAI